MEIHRVPHGKGGNYIMITSPDVEKVNPVEFYANWHMTSGSVKEKELMRLYKIPIPKFFLNKIIQKRVLAEWDEKYFKNVHKKIKEEVL